MATRDDWTFGIIGGTGMLGGAIARAILKHGPVAANRLWLSNRSGQARGFDAATITNDPQKLVNACDVVLLCVPPAAARELKIVAGNRLILSVMAGVTLAQLQEITGSSRCVRAMSSPAAEKGLAYSPWCASDDVNDLDRVRVRTVFEACGQTDEIRGDESLIDVFTAITGPVPGFVAFFADAVSSFAKEQGIGSDIADRATRQLFLAAGHIMADGKFTPEEHVQEMIDYAGTTAAGLEALKVSNLKADVATGLAAAVARARTISR